MNKVRSIYKSFIPYLAIFVAMLVIIWFMDQYAEQLAKKPDVIMVGSTTNLPENSLILSASDLQPDGNDESGLLADSLFIEAREAFRDKNYKRAHMLFSRLESNYSESAIPHNYLGIIAFRQNNIPSAIEAFSQAAEKDTSWYEPRVNLASVLRKANRTDEAEQFYLKAKDLKPNDPDIHYNLGLLYLEERNNDDASKAFERSIALSSGKKKARSYCMRGITRLEQLDTLGARSDFNEAILLWPDYELARLNYSKTEKDQTKRLEEFNKLYRLNSSSYHANYYLANDYDEQGDFARAEFHYRKALNQDPSNNEIIKALSNILIDQNRMEEAKLVINGFVAGDTLPQAYFMRAKIAARENNQQEALRLYEIAIEKSNGSYPEAYVNSAIIEKSLGNYKEAIRSYRNAIRVRPNYSLAYYNMALIYTETDSISRAIDSYKQAVSLDSKSYKSWYNLGRLYDRILENDLEIAAYQNALKVKPDYTRALLELGNAYLDVNGYREAIAAYENLLNIYPMYSKAWFNLGLSYSRLNNTEASIEAYEKLLQIEPEHIQGSINLAEQYAENGETDRAIQVMEGILSVEIDNLQIRQILGSYYLAANRLDEAAYQYLKLIDLEPGIRNHYDRLLDIYSEQEDDANIALAEFRKHKELGLDYDFYESAKNLHELGLIHEALKAYQFVLQQGNDSEWVDYWIGKAYMDMENFDRAIPKFEEVLDKDPEHKFAWYRLGQTYDMLGNREKAETYYSELRDLDNEFKIVRKNAI